MIAKKRLSLSMPLKDWVQEALSKPGIVLSPLSPNISIESTILPGTNLPSDPADKIIIATARVEKLILITRDQSIHRYAKQGHVKTVKA